MNNNQNHQTDPRENLMRLLLIGFGLAVVIAVVVACLPNRAAFGSKMNQSLASWQRLMPAKNWSSAELRHGRQHISYHNPMVRSTLSLPWASN
jgi:hypothetical protein